LRKLCPHCKRKTALNPATLDRTLAENVYGVGRIPTRPIEIYEKGKGCVHCSGGNAGRTVIAEVLAMNNELRELVYQRASNEKIVQAARKSGFRTMTDNALWLVAKGLVPLNEAEATVGPMTTEVPRAQVAATPDKTTATEARR
jgi:type II secretory ATPase GspE/PulE/Tfp pilus assembly ATPase PilB-like protein